jgi:hypothetical protein
VPVDAANAAATIRLRAAAMFAVLFRGNEPQVLRVYASLVKTNVVDQVPWWNRSEGLLEDNAVDSLHPTV